MTTPSTANSKPGGAPAEPVVEPGAAGPAATRPAVDGEAAPRLPHERDESSDSGTGAPSEVMEKAADDAASGQVDRPRGPAAQKHYSDLTERSAEPGRRQGGR